MTLLIAFAFLAGLVTILSPCILPLLPIILAGGTTEDKNRPGGVILGFVGSFTFFTLTLSSIVKATGINADTLRNIAVITLVIFGLSLTIPALKHIWERLTSRFTSGPSGVKHGFWGGIGIGVSLGLVWTPCVGPILASVITLAASSTITYATVLITLAYSIGTAIPLLLIMRGSGIFLRRFSWLKKNSGKIQQFFGVFMLATALLIYFQLDRRFQSYILEKFPGYGTGLTSLEDTTAVREKLNELKQKGGTMTSDLKNLGPAPELVGGGNWINSQPLTLRELEGKVVLIDFWTYSCINCIRTLPYLKAWHAKYSDKGLVIIGVHSPEFEFEKSTDNVTRAVKDFGIQYPVVQDNDFKIWRAYENHYWPAKYMIDREGKIRYTHFGEGEYDETEMLIQELLGESVNKNSLVDVPGYRIETRSPETYVGYWRIANVVSYPDIKEDEKTTYTTPSTFPTNGIGFQGEWIVREKHSVPSPGSSLRFRFDAKEVNLVMRPAVAGKPQKVKILIDGKVTQEITIDGDRLYNLVKLDNPGNHYITIEYPEGKVEVYAFTFG